MKWRVVTIESQIEYCDWCQMMQTSYWVHESDCNLNSNADWKRKIPIWIFVAHILRRNKRYVTKGWYYEHNTSNIRWFTMQTRVSLFCFWKTLSWSYFKLRYLGSREHTFFWQVLETFWVYMIFGYKVNHASHLLS